MRSLSNLLSRRALEKVETNSTFSRRKVSHVVLNQSGVQEAVHVSLGFRDCVAGSFRRKRRQNSLQSGNEKKHSPSKLLAKCIGEKVRCSEIFASCSRRIR